jgi:hypothetical protein
LTSRKSFKVLIYKSLSNWAKITYTFSSVDFYKYHKKLPISFPSGEGRYGAINQQLYEVHFSIILGYVLWMEKIEKL